MFFEISQNSQGGTCARASFLIKLPVKSLWQKCFSVNFAKFLRTPFLQNTSGGCFCFCLCFQHDMLFLAFVRYFLKTHDTSDLTSNVSDVSDLINKQTMFICVRISRKQKLYAIISQTSFTFTSYRLSKTNSFHTKTEICVIN